MRTVVLFLPFLFSLAGCISVQLGEDKEADDRVTASTSDPGASCEYLGRVQGFDPNGTVKEAEHRARHEASNLGGNYFRIESVDQRTARVSGLAYRCLR